MAKRKSSLSRYAIDSEIELYCRNRAMIHLEAAIGSLLDNYTVKEVAAILKAQGEHMEQFG